MSDLSEIDLENQDQIIEEEPEQKRCCSCPNFTITGWFILVGMIVGAGYTITMYVLVSKNVYDDLSGSEPDWVSGTVAYFFVPLGGLVGIVTIFWIAGHNVELQNNIDKIHYTLIIEYFISENVDEIDGDNRYTFELEAYKFIRFSDYLVQSTKKNIILSGGNRHGGKLVFPNNNPYLIHESLMKEIQKRFDVIEGNPVLSEIYLNF